MAYIRDATVADAPGIAAVWRVGWFAAYRESSRRTSLNAALAENLYRFKTPSHAV
jgi:hypothetical protein